MKSEFLKFLAKSEIFVNSVEILEFSVSKMCKI